MTHFSSRILCFIVLCIGLSSTLLAQNLVINPGFEDFEDCPSTITNFNTLVKEVSLPTASSGDYFNSCGSKDFAVPENFKGRQRAAEGSGYAGLYFYALNDYREYLQLNTSKTLREKFPYKISVKVSLAEASTLALKNMSVVVTNTKIKVPNSSALVAAKLNLLEGVEFYEVKLSPDKSMANTEGWITLSGEFEAKGFENHIIIGNFNDNRHTQLLNKETEVLSKDFSYYYIDDFVLEEQPRINYEQDKIYVLERNPFEPKGYELDKEAIASVNKIFKFLKENAEVQMKITGHSDDAGSPEYNKFVSSLRARAVALYLRKRGIDESRIVWEGAGDTKPLRNGKIRQGEANPRVEFVMTSFDNE